MRKILYLSDFCPWPLDNGFRQRIYHLLQALSRTHEVTLATVMPESYVGMPFPPAQNCVELIPLSETDCAFNTTGRFERWAPAGQRFVSLVTSPFPNLVRRYRSPQILQTLRTLFERRSFHAVWAERPFIAELARRAGFRRIVVDLPDVETVSYARALAHGGWYPSKPLHLLELAKLHAYDQALPLRFWRVVVCKEEDRLFFRRRSNVVTLPNGVEDHPASPDVATGDAPRLMFVGALNFESNIFGVQFFAQSVMPLIRREYPGARFVVVGRDPLPVILDLQNRGECSVLSGISDLTPQFDASSLFVAPIYLGGGTRLKVLEAIARGKAVVASTIAAEGLDVRPGIDLEVADSAEGLAAACCRLLRDAEARRRIAASGRLRVLERYRWDQLTRIAEAVLSDSLQRAPCENASRYAPGAAERGVRTP